MGERTAFEVGRLYQPIKQIADVLTASQKDIFIRLPGLEEYWPCGIRTSAGQLAEHGGGGSSLTMFGTVPTGFDGDSYAHLGNGVNYFNQGSVAGITGGETYIDAAIRGLTVGGWFMVDTQPSGSSDTLISRDGTAPQRGYQLSWTTVNLPRFGASGTGAAIIFATGPTATTGVWHFIVGRFTPSTEIAIFVDGDKTVNVTAIPATVNVSTAAFQVGRRALDDSSIIHAKARDVFVCAAALEDDIIAALRANSQPAS